MTNGLVNSQDLYRAALVQAVAALDTYIHGTVHDRTVDIILGRHTVTSPSAKIGLDFYAIRDILSATSAADTEIATRTYVAQRLARETFQKPDDIAAAMAMVGVGKIWTTAFSTLAEQKKKALNLVVSRRNQIVHACDFDYVTPGAVTPMTHTDALDAIAIVEDIVSSFDAIL
jgi:hypothetical protein